MSRFYLNVPFKEKDQAKRLGARFDWEQKRWYVHGDTDLSQFAPWLPPQAEATAALIPSDPPLAPGLAETAPHDPATSPHAADPGIPLSQLLHTLAHAVREACGPEGIWTLVEVVDVKARGHLYLEVSERNEQGQPIATARAILWQSTAARVLPQFERMAGTPIRAGIKLLVRVRPELHPQYGLSLHIDALDARYTLGELEARRREIRTQLQREGVFERNRQLPAPWDYRSVLVIAPEQGAGLGDFRKEAARLERFGLCRFVYAYSRFQGEGAALDIIQTYTGALHDLGVPPDAVVIIRGGGAAGDLAWLDDFQLVRSICLLPIPVMTGIGHERDNVLLDEVAHTRYDTPSKVIAGIEQAIRWRAQQALAHMSVIVQAAHDQLHQAARQTDRDMSQIRADARHHVAMAHSQCNQASLRIQHGAHQTVQMARLLSQQHLRATKDHAQRQVAMARQRVPYLLRETLKSALDLSRLARSQALGLTREILGQGPDKALTRGFAIVRTAQGAPIMRKARAHEHAQLDIQFKDGTLPVKPL